MAAKSLKNRRRAEGGRLRRGASKATAPARTFNASNRVHESSVSSGVHTQNTWPVSHCAPTLHPPSRHRAQNKLLSSRTAECEPPPPPHFTPLSPARNTNRLPGQRCRPGGLIKASSAGLYCPTEGQSKHSFGSPRFSNSSHWFILPQVSLRFSWPAFPGPLPGCGKSEERGRKEKTGESRQ